MPFTLGIDVSNWQGAVGWNQVAAAGVEFGIAKVSEGVTYRDPYFTQNWHGMGAAGMVRGGYHYAQPDYSPPDVEAAFFLRCVDAAGGLLPGDLLVLDLEAGSGNLATWAQTWLGTVEAAVGFKPWLYSGAWFLEPHGCTHDATLAQYGLWIASYGTVPATPPSWPFVACWQFSCEATVPGVAGPCDANLFQGDLAQLKRYGLPESAPPGTPAGGAPAGNPPAGGG